MENYVATLEYLIGLKKNGKKDPSVIERDDFRIAWAGLVSEAGFNNQAEAFLYEGYTYCGAVPFYDYMKKSSSYMTAVQELYRGCYYGRNCVNTSAILIHLLALSINDSKKDMDVIASLICRIPAELKNKEGKLYGQADRVLKKYFFDKIRPDAEFPGLKELSEHGLQEISVKTFASVIDAITVKMDFSSFNKVCQKNKQRVDAWLHSPVDEKKCPDDEFKNSQNSSKSETIYAETEAARQEYIKTNNPDSSKNREITGRLQIAADKGSAENIQELDEDVKMKTDGVFSGDSEEIQTVPEKFKKAAIELNNRMVILQKEKAVADKEIVKLRTQVSELNLVRDRQMTEISTRESDIAEKDKIIDSLRERVYEAEKKVSELNIQITEKDRQLEQNEEGMAQLSEMIDMLRRDRSRQSEEAVKRLSTKLRYLYLDYQDARELTMSDELGENMRDQLGEVFRILISAGITF